MRLFAGSKKTRSIGLAELRMCVRPANRRNMPWNDNDWLPGHSDFPLNCFVACGASATGSLFGPLFHPGGAASRDKLCIGAVIWDAAPYFARCRHDRRLGTGGCTLMVQKLISFAPQSAAAAAASFAPECCGFGGLATADPRETVNPTIRCGVCRSFPAPCKTTRRAGQWRRAAGAVLFAAVLEPY